MKTTLYFVCILSAFALSLMSSCKDKDQPEPITETPLEMPPFTDTGANMFAFKVDGKVVVAENLTGNNLPKILAYYLPLSSVAPFFSCEGRYWKGGYYESIEINIDSLSDTGVYEIHAIEENGRQGKYRIGTDQWDYDVYITSNQYIGEVEITKIDTINKIIAGRFRFLAKHIYSTSTKKITEGQFDVKYYP